MIVRNGKGKNGQPEVITPLPMFFEAIAEYLKVRPVPKPGHEKALFLSAVTRRRISEDTVRRIILTAQSISGVKPNHPITPHHFRASVITPHAQSGSK